MKLWDAYLALGGSLEPEPDTQSPFFDAEEWRRTLLMGAQACVFYGAAEFSRDLDLLVLVDAGNLNRLRQALDELEAHVVAVPFFEQRLLEVWACSPFPLPARRCRGLAHRCDGAASRRRWIRGSLATPHRDRGGRTAAAWPHEAQQEARQREALEAAIGGHAGLLVEYLESEEKQERERDRLYWLPLKRELEQLRHAMRQ